MKKDGRRTFIKKFGLAVGALSIGAGEAAAFVYQKKSGIRKVPAVGDPTTVDFRNAPVDWQSPVRYPGATGQTFVGRTGSVMRPGGGDDGFRLEVFVTGAGEPSSVKQRCDEPHIPFVQTSLTYPGATVELGAFSSNHEDEGAVDNMTIAVSPADARASVRLVVTAGAALDAAVDDDDDVPNGAVCVVRRSGGGDHPVLVLNARPVVTREGDALVLTIPPPAGAGPSSLTIRVPAPGSDSGDIADGIPRIAERAAAERERWNAWKAARGPAGWDLPGSDGEFAIAGARIIDQLTTQAAATGEKKPVPPASARPDLVDEHFISEAEFYLGRDGDAKRRLEAVWNLEDEQGQLVGAGGAANMKEMCAAVYSLCRHAELTGEWTTFNELYPDAFNALDSLRVALDAAAGAPVPSAQAVRKLLPEGSPGTGWSGAYEELTNTIWALVALKGMLEISDRFFLSKKSEIREMYGQLLMSLNTRARETMRTDPAGFAWFPIVGAPVGGGGADVRPQAGLGTFSVALFPGLLYKKDDKVIQGYPALVNASLADGVPAGTGPGGAGSVDPVDAAVVAQTLIWLSLPEDARKMFTGCLNHASPVYTWAGTPGGAAGAAGPVSLRATAESLRFLRHAMVLEDDGVLRLFQGIAAADLAAGKPMRLENTPTRWGRVSVALEPVDARTWKATYRRELVNPKKAPPLKSIEMPRVLGPNFRFDTISPGSAVKNGPTVIIDAEPLKWEAYLKDLMRHDG